MKLDMTMTNRNNEKRLHNRRQSQTRDRDRLRKREKTSKRNSMENSNKPSSLARPRDQSIEQKNHTQKTIDCRWC